MNDLLQTESSTDPTPLSVGDLCVTLYEFGYMVPLGSLIEIKDNALFDNPEVVLVDFAPNNEAYPVFSTKDLIRIGSL